MKSLVNWLDLRVTTHLSLSDCDLSINGRGKNFRAIGRIRSDRVNNFDLYCLHHLPLFDCSRKIHLDLFVPTSKSPNLLQTLC